MRKKRRNTRNGVLIDLTSLLDVIFILLLVVICSYNYEKQKNVQDAATAQKSLQAAEVDAKSNSKAYSDMIETQDDIQKYVWVASIVAPYEPDDITIRHIKVLTEDNEIISVDFVGNNIEESKKEFKKSLTDYVKKYQDRPVIISLNENDDSILYRDEKEIKTILDDLAHDNKNVYIKGNIREE